MTQPELQDARRHSERASYVFVTCQPGAEKAIKAELARERPSWRFAYSRSGFLTFKLPEDHELEDDFALRSVFARTYGFSLGRADGGTAEQRAASAWQLAAGVPIDALHAWLREEAFREPPEWYAPVRQALAAAAPQLAVPNADMAIDDAPATQPGHYVLDVVLVSEDEWWVGFHRARSGTSRWPGGQRPDALPEDAVSRAYLKMREALRWSKLPIEPGQNCVELGCAPGGAAQAMLEAGLHVTGIDPAEVHESLLAHPNFTHIRRRAKAVRRREFRRTRWLFSDMNVPPSYTLDSVEAIVTHPEVNVRGLLLTLKLPDWKLAEQFDEYLERIRSWGYKDVRARQLQHNRQEVCVAALKRQHMR